MINPYFCYVFSFVTALLVYLLGWSDLYPKLSLPLFVFLIITIVLFIFCGVMMMRRKTFVFKPVTVTGPLPIAITIFIYLLWTVEFIYEGGIPLVRILMNQPFDYRIFGVPSFHVFTVTFSSFYTVYLFYLFLSLRKKHILLLYFINLLAALLIYNRGMFLFNLSASSFLFFISLSKIPRLLLLIFPIALTMLFFLFGVMGTLRVSNESKTRYDNNLFLAIGQASQSFKTSVIPKEFFWSYIYISSPLANLQHNINTYAVNDQKFSQLPVMINNELLMDFVSKRINTFFKLKPEDQNRIPGPFNVSTVYAKCFSYMGWIGMLIMLLWILIVPWLYLKFLPVSSAFFQTGFVILCTIYLFLAFDNTLKFTGLSFQLVYPVLFHFVTQKLPHINKFFVHNKVTGF